MESFRFHTESREKLIEIYKDQGMSRVSLEQLMPLAQVYDKLGDAAFSGDAGERIRKLQAVLNAK